MYSGAWSKFQFQLNMVGLALLVSLLILSFSSQEANGEEKPSPEYSFMEIPRMEYMSEVATWNHRFLVVKNEGDVNLTINVTFVCPRGFELEVDGSKTLELSTEPHGDFGYLGFYMNLSSTAPERSGFLSINTEVVLLNDSKPAIPVSKLIYADYFYYEYFEPDFNLSVDDADEILIDVKPGELGSGVFRLNVKIPSYVGGTVTLRLKTSCQGGIVSPDSLVYSSSPGNDREIPISIYFLPRSLSGERACQVKGEVIQLNGTIIYPTHQKMLNFTVNIIPYWDVRIDTSYSSTTIETEESGEEDDLDKGTIDLGLIDYSGKVGFNLPIKTTNRGNLNETFTWTLPDLEILRKKGWEITGHRHKFELGHNENSELEFLFLPPKEFISEGFKTKISMELDLAKGSAPWLYWSHNITRGYNGPYQISFTLMHEVEEERDYAGAMVLNGLFLFSTLMFVGGNRRRRKRKQADKPNSQTRIESRSSGVPEGEIDHTRWKKNGDSGEKI